MRGALLFSRFDPFTDQVFSLEYSLLAAFYFLFLISVLINRRFETIFSARALRYLGTIAYGRRSTEVASCGSMKLRLNPNRARLSLWMTCWPQVHIFAQQRWSCAKDGLGCE